MDEQQAYQEMKSKLSDRYWRLNNLYHIKDKSGQKVKFNFNWAQDKFYNEMWYFNVILKARQLGFSTFTAISYLDACLFNSDHKAGIIDASLPDAKKKLKMIKYAYNSMHPQFKDLIPYKVNSTQEVEWENGSAVSVGTSHRGDTLQKLHISEYGKISAHDPQKAAEIKTGALNAVDSGQQITIESTAEGKMGEFYELVTTARKLQDANKNLVSLEPKFHFFPWYQNPDYTMPKEDVEKVVIPSDLIEYFAKKQLDLTAGQKAWYTVKKSTMKDAMGQEYPTDPDEAFAGSLKGAFYSDEMRAVREAGQIRTVAYDARYPVSTFWDIGKSRDMMVIWFYQYIDGQHRFIDYHESNGQAWAFYAKLLNDRGYNYDMHYFPHDGEARQVGAKEVKTAKQNAESVGIKPIRVQSVTKSVYGDIMNDCKPVLPMCYFDEQKCSTGIEHMDNYRRRWDEKNAMFLNEAVHDKASHGADGFRTFAVQVDKVVVQKGGTTKKVSMRLGSGRGGSYMGM